MRTRRLGATDLDLTPIGLGTWAMGGGDWKFGWGAQDDEESVAAIRRTLDAGVNWIDTAPVYGLGHGEEVVGRALEGLTEKPIVATKCGRVSEDGSSIQGCLKRESILREVDESLRRLKLDVIDLVQLHWPQPDEDIEEGWEAVAEAVRAGKVRHAGVSNFSVAQLKRIQPIHPVASLQPPYSMIVRGVEDELLDFCGANRIGVVVYSPMQKGLLTGKITEARMRELDAADHRHNDANFRPPRLGVHRELVDGIGAIAQRHGRTPAQLALAWVLRRSEVTSAIAGARRPDQIEETVVAGDWELSDGDIAAIDVLLAKHAESLSAL